MKDSEWWLNHIAIHSIMNKTDIMCVFLQVYACILYSADSVLQKSQCLALKFNIQKSWSHKLS